VTPSYSLDLDQDACSFLLLQMNKHQKIFEFQIVKLEKLPYPGSQLFYWLDNFALGHSKSIDYWIAITSENIPGHSKNEDYHFETISIEEIYSCKRLWIITSLGWERYYSPPSVFEYLSSTVFRCALESVSRELQTKELSELKSLQDHGGQKHESYFRFPAGSDILALAFVD
jgi:hypothetical protein